MTAGIIPQRISADEFDIIWSRTPDSETNVSDNCVTTVDRSIYCLADGERGSRYFADRTGKRLTADFNLNPPLSFFATDSDRDGRDEIYVKGRGGGEALVFDLRDINSSPWRALPDIPWIKIPYDYDDPDRCFGIDWFSANEALYISARSALIYVSTGTSLDQRHLMFAVNEQSWLYRWPGSDKPYRFLHSVDRIGVKPDDIPADVLLCGMRAVDDRSWHNLRKIIFALRAAAWKEVEDMTGPYSFAGKAVSYNSPDTDIYITRSNKGGHDRAAEEPTELYVGVDPFWGGLQRYFVNRAGLIYRRVNKECGGYECQDYYWYYDMTPLTPHERSRAVEALRAMEAAHPDNTNVRSVRTIFENYVVPGWASE